MTLHSPIGASSAERWMNCPGSIELSKGLPKSTSKYAAEGTAAHEVGAFYLKAGTNVDSYWLDEEIEVIDDDTDITHTITVTEEMIEAVDDYVISVYQEMDKYQIPHNELKVEVEFNLNHLHPEAFGTCDASFIVPFDRIVVIDYKHGAGVIVDVENNKQLRYYALGAYYSIPPIDREDLSKVQMMIVQPRANHENGSVRSEVIMIEELLAFEKELKDAMHFTESPEGKATLQAGKWCRFCTAKAICPAIRNDIATTAQASFANVSVSLVPPQEMSMEFIAKVLEQAEQIKGWVKAVQEYAHSLAEAGRSIPGYKLAARRSNRKWLNEDTVRELFEFDFGDSIYNKELRSPSQMEKLIGKGAKAIVGKFTFKPDAGKVLVKEEDARERQPAEAVLAFLNC